MNDYLYTTTVHVGTHRAQVPGAWCPDCKTVCIHGVQIGTTCLYCRREGYQVHGNVRMGARVMLAAPVDINGNKSEINIGDDCDIASFVSINCADSHMRCIGVAADIERKPITIGDHVFIGQGATILGGCNIGSRSVIGAGVVLKGVTVPPYSRVRMPFPYIEKGFYTPDGPGSNLC